MNHGVRKELIDDSASYSEALRSADKGGDSRYICFERTGPGPEIVRITVKGGKPEVILSLKDLHTTGEDPAWFSLTPEGDVLPHDTGGGTEIYALSWNAP